LEINISSGHLFTVNILRPSGRQGNVFRFGTLLRTSEEQFTNSSVLDGRLCNALQLEKLKDFKLSKYEPSSNHPGYFEDL
jgi:hypothetical protein